MIRQETYIEFQGQRLVNFSAEKLKDHISFTSSQEIIEIAQPMFKHFNIQGFSFNRYYKEKDKTIFLLSTNTKVLEAYFRNIGSINSSRLIPLNTKKYIILHNWVNNIENINIRKKFFTQIKEQEEIGIGEDFAIIKNYNEYTDFFEFQTFLTDHTAIERLMNNLDVLEHFIAYFYDRARPIIKKANINKIVFHSNNLCEPYSLKDAPVNIKQFLAETKIKHFYCIDLHGNEQVLSNREWECAVLLCLGGTAQSVSSELCISPRTAEMHISALKLKLGCADKTKLVNYLNTLNLIKSFRL